MAYFERFVAFSLLHEEIDKSIQKIKSEYMSRFGLHSSDAILLAMLDQHPEGLTAAALARACGVDRAIISRALPNLISSGTVTYAEESAKKHSYRAPLGLSDRGRDVVKKMHDLSVLVVKTASGEIPTEELAVFYRVMRTINRNLADHARLLEEETEEKGSTTS